MEPQYLGERYRLDHMLGRGSSTEVHRAHDTMLGRTVAVKTLRFPLANDASLVARFRREARSAALLNHPAIVAVYDVGTGSLKGVSGPYIVMEYIDGSTLRDLLRFEARPVPERSLEIVVEVLRALEYAHRKGVVHRDVQPASVMLTRNDRVKVMDFGIARATGSVGGTTRQTAVMIGTVRYPSPEQAKGEQIDTRSDIYATGCLLYELLTNRPPFIGDSPVTVAYRHMSEEPQPPSAFGPGISPALDAMVLKALAKEPNNRCQSAAEMRLDVEDHLGGRVGTATGRPVVGPASSSGDSEFEAGPGLADRITLSTQVAGHSAVVRVGGELDYASVGSVAELLHRLRRQGYLHYVVLFEETAALDSAGLNVFLSHRVAVMALSGSMRVVIESSSIHRVFEVLDLDAVLTVHDSLDEAINAMRAAENRSEP
ncbi:protein kinase [Streptomyces sp. NPDC050703]|uniref:protein kinase domain-containing protein n=1 Tax=Streptomyces sp. NPDC050703 TaxID=3157218 RepID=UPI0034281393